MFSGRHRTAVQWNCLVSVITIKQCKIWPWYHGHDHNLVWWEIIQLLQYLCEASLMLGKYTHDDNTGQWECQVWSFRRGISNTQDLLGHNLIFLKVTSTVFTTQILLFKSGPNCSSVNNEVTVSIMYINIWILHKNAQLCTFYNWACYKIACPHNSWLL
jgi:hypothetical protein